MTITLGVDAVVRERAITHLDFIFRAGPEIDAGQLDQVREAATRCQSYKTYLLLFGSAKISQSVHLTYCQGEAKSFMTSTAG
jgi:hypothetical protein